MTPSPITRWLLQPVLWRFVGFASTVVGLLCYGLSSSFDHLFGEWNLLKMILYSVFAFIICLAVLFAKVCQHSTSLWSKTHLAFLVLIITSVYTFFFDKVVNGKPDIYSLISCAAFAVMSLSLSKQIHLGFEVDLLYFFLGCLIIQLMKIHLSLVIVGAVFSYFLVIFRSFLDAPTENGYVGLQDQQNLVIQVGSLQQATSEDPLFQVNDSQQDCTPVVSMPGLKLIIEDLRILDVNIPDMLGNLLNEYLKDKDQIPAALIGDHNFFIDMMRLPTTVHLHEKVKLMVARGLQKECLDEYSRWRRNFLERCLSKLKLKMFKAEDIEEEKRIRSWIKAFNVVLKILLPKERRLCDNVFFGLSFAADLSFMEVCREITIKLLNFAVTFVDGTCSLNHLCNILKVNETLHDLNPEFEALFSDQCSVSLRIEANSTLEKLEEAIRGIFKELENLICHDTGSAAVNGGICPVTVEVMNNLSACRGGKSSWLSVLMARIMEMLERHLEAKSKECTDHALGYIFMMNNLRYMEQKTKEYGLGAILGDNWMQQHIAKVQQNLKFYCQSSWDDVLGFLELDINKSVEANVAAESLKEKLNSFNWRFKEIWKVQCTWVIIDEQLREEIITSLEDMLLLAYGIFIGGFMEVLGKHADKYIWYSMFDIQGLLKDLFDGSS